MSECSCNIALPPRLLRGVTRTVRVTVVDKNNNPVDLTVARNVVVTVSLDGAGRSEAYVPGISIQGDDNNVVEFAWYADVQRRCGRYTIDINADFGNRNQSRVDFHREFGVELVEHSCDVSHDPQDAMEVDDDLDLEGTLEVTTDGMSAFDQWRTSPESEGYPPTEEGFFAWMRQPATDAAADVEAGEAARNAAEAQRVAAEQAREAQAASDHSRAASDHTTAASDHSLAASDHVTAGQDHTQAVSDHDTAAADHTTAGSDHTKAVTDHTTAASDHTVAVSDHEAAAADHSRAATDHNNAASDHTQAGQDHTVAVGDHTTAGEDHTRAGQDHSLAASDHSTAEGDHTRAAADHTAAAEDHSRAASDHTTAGQDHTQAGQDHTTAGTDHTRAESDHSRAESDHARAEADHEAMQNVVPTPTAADKDKVLTVTDEQGTLGWEEPAGGDVDQTYDATSQNAQSGVAMAGALAGKQDSIADLSNIREGAAAGATALQSETDPTVPAWAKAQSKPTYNYGEIQNTPDLSQFITKSVNDLTNYYLKSETYTKAEVQSLISAIRQFTYEVVSTLPTATADTMHKIYLVPSADPQQQNVKDEFITIESSGSYSWEQIGSTAVDLSGYVTTTALNTALSAYTTTANLTTLLAGKQDVISDLATIRSGADAGATAYQKPSSGILKTDLEKAVQDSLALADSALQSYTETDPTVPSWAKQPTKPSYSYSEISGTPNLATVATSGSYNDLSDKPTIPTALSQLSDDSTHRLVTDTEKNTWNGKQNALTFDSTPTANSTNPVTSGGVKAYVDGAIPTVPTISTDIATDKASTTKTASPSAVYNEVHPAFGSSQPAGGMLPNVLYKLGTLTGNVTISFAAASDATIENEYKFTFTAGAALEIAWPVAITDWAGNCVENGTPVITGGNYYLVSVEDGIALIAEVEA